MGFETLDGLTPEGEPEPDDISITVEEMNLIEDVPDPEDEGFAMVGALAKWIKSIVQYATASDELEATKNSEVVFREDFDVSLVKLKRERVDAEIAQFRLNLLHQELDDANGRLRWANRRVEGGENKLSVAKVRERRRAGGWKEWDKR
jgi:hypothetical protein